MLRRLRADDRQAAERAAAGRRELEQGGLPLAAQDRLTALGRPGSAFTSDLSTSAFCLLRGAGFRPLAQLMGSCVYQVGFQYPIGTRRPMAYIRGEGQATPGSGHAAGWEYDSLGRRVYRKAAFGQVFELDVVSDAWREARGRALARLSQEAKLAGAHAVVCVRLRRGPFRTGGNLIEFVATGTGVRSERYELDDEPVLSNLSGPEFASLYAAGFRPVGIAAGTTVMYVLTGTEQKWARGPFAPNNEMRDYTQGFEYARKRALGQLGSQATELGAAGIVGLTLEVSHEEREHEGVSSRRQRDLVVTADAVGTAVVQLARETRQPPIGIALDVADMPRLGEQRRRGGAASGA